MPLLQNHKDTECGSKQYWVEFPWNYLQYLVCEMLIHVTTSDQLLGNSHDEN